MYIYETRLRTSNLAGDENAVLRGFGKRPEAVSPVTQTAEVARLTDEIIKLAQRNAWTGVERAYKTLESMGDEAFNLIPRGLGGPAAIHKEGANASRSFGDMLNWWKRLWRAKTSLDTAVGGTNDSLLKPILESLEYTNNNFGSVTVAPRSKSTSKKQRAQLKLIAVVLSTAPDLPTPDQLKSIAFAEQIIKETGSFIGLLPAGYYKLADESFTVENGPSEYTGKRPINVLWGK